jgi:hypothetical protein
MDTSRQLNTPLVQAVKAGEVPSDEEGLDLEGIELKQREIDFAPVKPKPIGEMRIDGATSKQSLDQEAKLKEERQRQKMLRRQAEDEEEIARERYGEEAPVQKKAASKAPPKFSPAGKKHPVLQRLRASLGLDDLEHSQSITLQGIKYTCKRLTREEIAKVISIATFHNADEANVRAYMETAIIAYSVKSIDDTEVADVFEVPFHTMKMSTGRDTPLNSKERQDKGAQMFFEFLVNSPTEVTETLVTFYEQNFPPVSMVDGESTLALCPTANCGYKAIIALGAERFCPHHGKPLRSEETLPNPS